MRRTVVDPRFQSTLANLMVDRGLSQRAVAQRASVSKSYLSELINGVKTPSPEVAHALDEVLDSGTRLADLVSLAGHPQDLDLITEAAARPRHVPGAAIDSLSRVLVAQRLLDDVMGSTHLIGPIEAQLRTVQTMVTEATGPTRPHLMHVAAQWAQFAGWLHTSTGRRDGARAWLSRARDWATEIDDPDLAATIVSYQAHVAWLNLEWPRTLGLATAALRSPDVYPGQRAYDAYQAARAHAVLNELPEAERLLAAGDDYAEQNATWTGPVPTWQYYREPWLWQLERGLVWRYMARWQPIHAGRAVESIKAGLAAMPAEMRGADWAAEYRVHLANAYSAAGVPDEAAAVLDEAQAVAEATRSRRVADLVRDGRRRVKVARAVG